MAPSIDKDFWKVILLVSVFVAFILLKGDVCLENMKIYSAFEFADTVDSTYRDKNDHNTLYVVFTSKKQADLSFRDLELSSIKRGDSLVKKKDSIALDWYRNGVLLERLYCICAGKEFKAIRKTEK